MDAHVDGALVSDFEDLIPTLNLKHFPVNDVAAYNLEPIHPDAFVVRLLETDPMLVLTAIKKQRVGLIRPALTQEDLLEVFKIQGLRRTARSRSRQVADVGHAAARLEHEFTDRQILFKVLGWHKPRPGDHKINLLARDRQYPDFARG